MEISFFVQLGISCLIIDNSAGKLSVDGNIVWKNNVIEEYFSNKFTKEICHTCKIAPLCGGGCRQRAKESKDINSCIYEYSQDDINRIILNRFYLRYLKD